MMLLHNQSIYISMLSVLFDFNGCQNSNHIESSEQWLQEICIAMLTQVQILRKVNFCNAYFLQLLFWWFYVVAILVTLKPDSTLNI